jgi:hypothetical protein
MRAALSWHADVEVAFNSTAGHTVSELKTHCTTQGVTTKCRVKLDWQLALFNKILPEKPRFQILDETSLPSDVEAVIQSSKITHMFTQIGANTDVVVAAEEKKEARDNADYKLGAGAVNTIDNRATFLK